MLKYENLYRHGRKDHEKFIKASKWIVTNKISGTEITWTIRTSAVDNYWRSVCYGNGLFVAVANSGTGNRVMTSHTGFELLE